MTLREVVYMIMDEIKLPSDDSYITEDHVKFLINKYRSYILKTQLDKPGNVLSYDNQQEICLSLSESSANCGDCYDGSYLISDKKVPTILLESSINIYPSDFYYFNANIIFVNKEKMRYVSNNRYSRNFIYASIGPDNRLWLKSTNPQFRYLERITMNCIFDEWEDAELLRCGNKCTVEKDKAECIDVMDATFPMENSLIQLLIQYCVKELLGAAWRPKDDVNNANDDLSDLDTYIRKNSKSSLQKQLDNDNN